MEPRTEYLDRAVEIAIRLAVLSIIVLGSLWMFSPFAMVVLWGIVLAVTCYPLHVKLVALVGGRPRLAAGVFAALCLVAVVVPAVLVADSLLNVAAEYARDVESGRLRIPPPTERVRAWPVIGERLHAIWHSAVVDLEGTASRFEPQLRDLGRWLLAALGRLAAALLHTVLAIVIAAVLLATSTNGASAARRIATKLGGMQGQSVLEISAQTIRSVVNGVILVALIQGVMAAAGLVLAGVPGAGLWSLLLVILAVMQLPQVLVLGPIVLWVFANNDSTLTAVLFTVWSVVVCSSDPFLKMLMLGRGVAVPMAVILIGAIGGLLQSGLIGLFVGPVILAIFFRLFTTWVHAGTDGEPLPLTPELAAPPGPGRPSTG